MYKAYKIFVLKKTFLSGEPLEKPELYQSMLLNPQDNSENLPEDYIADILDVLPEKQKARFRDGQWVKAEGVIYDRFDESMIVKVSELPEKFDRYAATYGRSCSYSPCPSSSATCATSTSKWKYQATSPTN